ncbi:MAG TPA: hypothetical protein VEF76_05755 [Patescibacteria group bacterium]|nr:hypothetical protein [Patescibacteria group bacterium]
MLMMCWFYCFDLAWFLYFAGGPIFFLCAMFALKRGLANKRKGLRQTAFMMMAAVTAKMFVIDPFLFPAPIKKRACELAPKLAPLACNADGKGYPFIQVSGLIIFVTVGYFIYEYYKIYMPDRPTKQVTPDQVHLRFWANLTMVSTMMMVMWQLAPWVGYLTVGCIPAVFILFTWQQLAVVNLGLLTLGFWKLESCVWQFKVSERERMKYVTNTWTPKDTLWMTVFIYMVTLGMSYVAHDIMVRTKSVPHPCGQTEIQQNRQMNDIDSGDMQIYR